MIKQVFIDIESTGINHKIHGIHQISGCIEIDGEIKEFFDFKLKPFDGCEYDSEALFKCGVSFEQLQEYPDEFFVYQKLKRLFAKYSNPFDKYDKYFFVGYNSNFDKEMMFEFWLRQKDEFFFSIFWGNHIDIMTLATEALKPVRWKMEDFKLSTVAKWLGIPIDNERLHNAEYDIEITRAVYMTLTSTIKRIPDSFNWDNINIKQPAQSIAGLFTPMHPSDEESPNVITVYHDPFKCESLKVELPSGKVVDIAQFKTNGVENQPFKTNGIELVPVIACAEPTGVAHKAIIKEKNDWNSEFQVPDSWINPPTKKKNPISDAFLKPTKLPETKINTQKPTNQPISDLDYKFTFGKHRGSILEQVIDEDPTYITYLQKDHKTLKFDDEIMILVRLKIKQKRGSSGAGNSTLDYMIDTYDSIDNDF